MKKSTLYQSEPPLTSQPGYRLVYATGLRNAELNYLRVNDIHVEPDGRVWLAVVWGPNASIRKVPVLAGFEAEVLDLMKNPYLFGKPLGALPHRGELALRRAYARKLYQQRLKELEATPNDKDSLNEIAIGDVMAALGHQNREVVVRFYLGLVEETVSDEDSEETR